VVHRLRGSAAHFLLLGGQALKWPNGTRGKAFSKPWQLVEHDESFELQDRQPPIKVREAIRRLVELGPRVKK
jgi:hypothetical protein